MEGLRFLVVEDSPTMRQLISFSLKRFKGCKIVEAVDGVDALKKLQTEEVDMILTDINMPVMDGLEFVKQLSGVANAKGVPVVMITTEGSESHVVQALSCGARGYIRKPFTAEQVKEHVLPVLAVKT